MKTKTVAKLKKEADKWFSKYVRLRDSYELNGERVADCITCSTTKPITQLQAGHFISRSKNFLRFNDLNVNAQCLGCNMFKSGEQYAYSKALDLKYGVGTASGLYGLRNETKKFTVAELEEIIKDCKEQIANYD